MAAILPPPPNPPAPAVKLIDPQTGQATKALTDFLADDFQWKKKVADMLNGTG